MDIVNLSSVIRSSLWPFIHPEAQKDDYIQYSTSTIQMFRESCNRTSAIAVVSLAFQLADSIQKIHEFWDSIQEAPEDVQNISANLKLLSTVLSEIAIEAQHQLPDDTLISVLKQCTGKVRALTTSINEIEPGFASESRRFRKWGAFRAVFKDKKLRKLHKTLERLKTTLILAQQNSCSRLNRSQNQMLENRLAALSQGLTTLSLKCCSERVTTVANAPYESDQHLEALRAEILRVASSVSNPVYRYGFEKAASKVLSDSFSELEIISSEGDRAVRASSFNEKLAAMVPEPGSNRYRAWRKDPFSYHRYISEHFFGTVHVERETFKLQSCQPDDLPVAVDRSHYLHQTSFAFHPAPWVIKLGFAFAIRLNFERSYIHGWKYTMETACPVPDDAFIFKLCREGNLAGVKSLLSEGQASVRDVDSLGRTALFFAAENALPELCKLLIEGGADKCSRTYVPIIWDTVRSPVTAAARDGIPRNGSKIEDRIRVFRLFEDCMDFSDGGSDSWMALSILADHAIDSSECAATDDSILIWALKRFISEVRKNFDKGEVASLLGFLTSPSAPKEALDILLGLGSNTIGTVERKDGYSSLLKIFAFADSFEQFHILLKRNPDLHCSGLDLEFSPHLESPTSLSLYSSWAFDFWRRGLADSRITREEFVRWELEHSVLVNAGWKTKTLLVMVNYKLEADYVDQHNFNCDRCRMRTIIRVQPYWVQKVEKIKHGLNPDPGRQYDSSHKSTNTCDVWSTRSEESEADASQHKPGAVEKGFDMLGPFSESHKKRNTSHGSGAFEEDFLEGASIMSELGILHCVYDRSLIVCIWCWEKHKEDGYKWIDRDSDSSHDSHYSDDDYSPYLFQS